MSTHTLETPALYAWADKARLNSAVRKLNAHHVAYGAGFYSDAGGRFFKARARNGALEVWDFEQWFPLPQSAVFHDHNGRNIPY